MLWRMEQKRFNHQMWHWMNVNIMPFIFHHGELWFSHNVFVSSKWTQRIRFLMSFIALPWTTVLVRLQLHSNSTSKRVLWVHICMLKVCKNSSHLCWFNMTLLWWHISPYMIYWCIIKGCIFRLKFFNLHLSMEFCNVVDWRYIY
jgi:hypothetical protein